MNIAVIAGNEEYLDRARALAECVGARAMLMQGEDLPKSRKKRFKSREYPLALLIDERGITLTNGETELRGDFGKMMKRAAEGNLNRELLIKAVRRELAENNGKIPTAIDATAGLGEDSFLLAAAGFKVRLYEHNPVAEALLKDALSRAQNGTDTAGLADIALRMEAVGADSAEELRRLTYRPDVILLDPMFPAKKRGGETKKKLNLLRMLETAAGNDDELLAAAISLDPKKIVIKRPLKGPYLGGRVPNYSLYGKLIRYDCLTGPAF